MPDTRTFLERQRDAALEEVRRCGARDRAAADIARGNSRDRIGEVVVIEDGDGVTTGGFVVETESRHGTTWMVVNDGKRSTTAWYTRQMAVLHLLAVRYGDGDGTGSAAMFAARVLGIKDEVQR